jgi:enoyl-CoA hydratase/carnithine racemase
MLHKGGAFMSVLIYEKKDRIAYITLNRPEKMNAINTELMNELAKTWVDFRDDDSVWVAVLTGAGKLFCAGADFQSIGEPGIQVGFNVLREDPNNYHVYKPIICAINGAVIGRAIALVLSCDIRIAAENVEFSVPEVKFGVIPGGADVLERFIPPAIAREMLFFGDKMNAQRAYEIGLINRVVPQDKLMSEAVVMAGKLANNSPLAMRGLKEMFSRSKDLDYRTAASIYETTNNRVLNSQDYAEGMKAISEKRKPRWQGK